MKKWTLSDESRRRDLEVVQAMAWMHGETEMTKKMQFDPPSFFFLSSNKEAAEHPLTCELE